MNRQTATRPPPGRRWGSTLVTLVAWTAALPSIPVPAVAQAPAEASPAGPVQTGFGAEPGRLGGEPLPRADATAAVEAFGASLLLPGGGQWLQGQRRSYAYLAVEALGWALFLHGRHRGAGLRDRYRELAWRVARDGRGTGPDVPGFEYYEALARYGASGAWDRDPGRPGLQPELDPGTYNGRIWALARELHPGETEDEEGSKALEYYREHAYTPDLWWDWSRNPEAADRYRRLIDDSDGAFRRATAVLGVIAANHVLSAVDGFLSVRLAAEPEPRGRSALAPISRDGRWRVEVHVPVEFR